MTAQSSDSFSATARPPTNGAAEPAVPPMAVRCLLIDDSKYDRQQMRRIAEQTRLSLDFTEVDSLDAAIEALRGDSFDVILMDQTLPDGDGTTAAALLARHLGEDAPPMIMVSGSDDAAMPARAIASGCVDFVSKEKLNIPRIEKAIRDAVSTPALAMLRGIARPDPAKGHAELGERLARVLHQAARVAERQAAAADELARLRAMCDELGELIEQLPAKGNGAALA